MMCLYFYYMYYCKNLTFFCTNRIKYAINCCSTKSNRYVTIIAETRCGYV